MDSQNWLSIEEAAKYLGLGKTKLYDLAQGGRIPANKLDKQWRFKKVDLDKWLGLNSIDKYFSSVNYQIEDNPGLREPQIEAYKAIYDYYRNGGRNALVQLPVGCGKSGLAAIAPFGIANGRVLVITPNLTIRNEMRDNLDIGHRKCFWRRTNVLKAEDMVAGPYVTTLDYGNLSVCDSSHIIVTNVQQLSTNKDKWLNKFDSAYFDMIIIDEAHHGPADSWVQVVEHFPAAKVLNLTATPFRTDGKEVTGEKVYRYPFRSATTKGYIKRLTAVYVSPKTVNLTFTDGNEKVTYTLDEVMALKEEDWFSRHIAMSERCNISIVDNSIEKMEQLRFGSSVKHQIIASAMTIDHGKKIQLLYEARGLNAAVIHSKLPKEEQDEIIRKLKNNDLDVIIQVQMLGEGFDHPNLSVAAIFTPYRSLSPYLQFVGRIMRVIHQNDPGNADNYGYIVTHAGMNIDQLLAQFKMFERDDEEFWASVTGGEEPEPPVTTGEARAMRKIKPIFTVDDEQVEELFEEPFIEDEQTRLAEAASVLDALGFDPEAAKKLLEGSDRLDGKRTTKAALPLGVRPQIAHRTNRAKLTLDVKRFAKLSLNNARLSMGGAEIPRKLMPGIGGHNNYVSAIVWLNKELKKEMGKDSKDGSRQEWTTEELDKAAAMLPQLSTKLVRVLIKAKKGGENDQG